ncbi:winged helix-turn-helix domain-containing protein [Natronorarus salvus]|uniref:winged helix-turn-helix domain-containing protein n=1 Tax=Natronorarus salvus TaxID=3117733 RepID=UPI002F265151
MEEPEAVGRIEPGGVSPTEAFSILGNGTRVAILQALWEGEEPMSFSDLREAVGVDKGNFNYHLNELSHFVRRREGGYELRETGTQVMRAVVAGTITEDPELGPVKAGHPCPFCGSSVELLYRNEHITVRCRDCAGVLGGDLPDGAFMHYAFPPAGLADRSLPEVVEAAHVLFEAHVATMMQGVCPACTARTEREVLVCEDHQIGAEGVCECCGSVPRIWATFTCRNCRYGRRAMLWLVAVYHPAAITALSERWEFDTFLELQRLLFSNPDYLASVSERVVSTDPLRLRVDLPTDSGALSLRYDEHLQVLDVTREG